MCAQKLWEWRWQGTNVFLLDLRKVYLKIYVDKALWPYQTVMLKVQRYCITWLGFDFKCGTSYYAIYNWLCDVPRQQLRMPRRHTLMTFTSMKAWFLLHVWKSTYQTMNFLVRIQRDWMMDLRCWACRSRGMVVLSDGGGMGSLEYSSKDYSLKHVLPMLKTCESFSSLWLAKGGNCIH